MCFILPSLWHCDWNVRCKVILTIIMMIVAKAMNSTPAYILKLVVDALLNKENAVYLVCIYILIKIVGDTINKLRDNVWAPVAANCEVYVEELVFKHLHKQSMAFHVSREIGKIISI